MKVHYLTTMTVSTIFLYIRETIYSIIFNKKKKKRDYLLIKNF